MPLGILPVVLVVAEAAAAVGDRVAVVRLAAVAVAVVVAAVGDRVAVVVAVGDQVVDDPAVAVAVVGLAAAALAVAVMVVAVVVTATEEAAVAAVHRATMVPVQKPMAHQQPVVAQAEVARRGVVRRQGAAAHLDVVEPRWGGHLLYKPVHLCAPKAQSSCQA